MIAPEVWFPYLGIKINKLNPVAFKIFGISIYWYGIIIGCAVLCGLLLALRKQKEQIKTLIIILTFIV